MGYLFLNDTVKQIENDFYADSKSEDILMQRAGYCVYKTVTDNADKKSKIIILTGASNNGGDGYVAARILFENGYDVEICRVFKPKSDLCVKQSLQYKGKLYDFNGELPKKADILVDAVFGTGFFGEPDEYVKSVFKACNNVEALKIAVDIPSGLNADSGECSEYSVNADITVTFIGLKKCHIFFPASEMCGKIILEELDIKPELLSRYKNEALITDKIKIPKRAKNTHKGTYGTAMLVCGSYGMSGAAVLALRAALRSGVGIAKTVLPENIYSIVTTSVPEAVCYPIGENHKLPEEQIASADCVLIGCGLSKTQISEKIFVDVLKNCKKKVIIDADGLNILSECIDLTEGIKAELIITPHPGEMSRLCKVSIKEIESNRVFYAEKLAKELNAVVVLKGAHTVIAQPNGNVYFNITGNAGMSTGGSGDVLSGIIAAMCAQGKSAVEAAVTAVYIHGFAGDLAEKKFGEVSMLPSDIIDFLPEAFKISGGS